MHYINAMLRRSHLLLFTSSVVLCCLIHAAVAFSATKKAPLKPVNLNSATSEELQEVPGIGPATADKILQMRKSYGPFKSVDDLVAIRGIGKKRLDKMRKYLTAGKSPTASKSGQPASCAGCAKTLPAKQAAPPTKPNGSIKPSAVESLAGESESETQEPQSR
jgi:comEA protein